MRPTFDWCVLRSAQMAGLRLGLADRAILESVDSERRGKLEVLGSVNNLRKLSKGKWRQRAVH